jgi:hypothetical protein
VMGIPVSIHHPTYGRLQVGVVTLAGTAPVAESVLAPSGAGPEALADIRSSLETQAAALLTPPTAQETRLSRNCPQPGLSS